MIYTHCQHRDCVNELNYSKGQKAFCCREHFEDEHARRYKAQQQQIRIIMIGEEVIRYNALKENSSEEAYNEAIKLIN